MRPVHPLFRLNVLLSLLVMWGLGPGARFVQAQTPLPPSTIGPVQLSSQPEIEAGFRLLYDLKFQEARSIFRGWEQQHPGEALGPAAESASYLFQEFDRQGVLTLDFFLDNKKFLGGGGGTPRPEVAGRLHRPGAPGA